LDLGNFYGEKNKIKKSKNQKIKNQKSKIKKIPFLIFLHQINKLQHNHFQIGQILDTPHRFFIPILTSSFTLQIPLLLQVSNLNNITNFCLKSRFGPHFNLQFIYLSYHHYIINQYI